MSEVERLYDDIIMMKSGRIVDQGTAKKLIEKHGRNNLKKLFKK